MQFLSRCKPSVGLDPEAAVRQRDQGFVGREALRKPTLDVRPPLPLEVPTGFGVIVPRQPSVPIGVDAVVRHGEVGAGPAGHPRDPTRPVQVPEFVLVGRPVPHARAHGRELDVLPPLQWTAGPRLDEEPFGTEDPRAQGDHAVALDGHEVCAPPVDIHLGQILLVALAHVVRPGREHEAAVRRAGRGTVGIHAEGIERARVE